VCCDAGQFQQLRDNFVTVQNLLLRCPACYLNFAKTWCHYTCSPDQSTFVRVVDSFIHPTLNVEIANETEFTMEPAWAETVYRSCLGVSFNALGRTVLSVLFRVNNARDWFRKLGDNKAKRGGESPTQITMVFRAGVGSLAVQNRLHECQSRAVDLLNGSPINVTCGCRDCCAACPGADPSCSGAADAVFVADEPSFSVSLATLIVALVVALFFILLFSVYGYYSRPWCARARKAGTGSNGVELSASGPSRRGADGSFGGAGAEDDEASAVISRAPPASDGGLLQRSSSGLPMVDTGAATVEPSAPPPADAPAAPQSPSTESGKALGHGASQKTGCVGAFFYRLGLVVGTYPLMVIGCVLAVTVALGVLGLSRLKIETDPLRLWVPSGSELLEQKEFFDDQFQPFWRVVQIFVSRTPEGAALNGSVLQADALLRAQQLEQRIEALSVVAGGNNVTFQSLCYRPIIGKGCLKSTPMQWFFAQPPALQLSSNLTAENVTTVIDFCALRASLSRDECLGEIGSPTFGYIALGGFPRGTSDYTRATALVLTYLLNQVSPTDSPANTPAKEWEKAVIALLKSEAVSMRASGLRISFNVERAIEDELERESSGSAIITLYNYLVMFLYMGVAMGFYFPWRAHLLPERTKFGLALAAVIGISCELVMAFAICALAGVKASLIISGVVPFLVLAIGVDNNFIFTLAFHAMPRSLPPAERIARVFSELAVSVILAGSCIAFTFFLGVLTRMPAVVSFVLYAGTAIVLDVFILFTGFSAAIVLDARREESRRMDCLPCFRNCLRRGGQEAEDDATEAGYQPAALGEDAAAVTKTNGEGNGSGAAATGPAAPPSSRTVAKNVSLTRLLVARYYAPWLLQPAVSLCVLFAFGALCIFSALYANELELGLDQRLPIPRDSFLQDYFNDLEGLLRAGPPVYFVASSSRVDPNTGIPLGDLSYTDNQNRVCSLYGRCSPGSVSNVISLASRTPSESRIVDAAISWIDDYLTWITSLSCCTRRNFSNTTLGELCNPEDEDPACERCLGAQDPASPPSPADFRRFLPWFFLTNCSESCAVCGTAHVGSVRLDAQNVVTASRFWTYHTPMASQRDFIESLRAARSLADSMSASSGLDVFAYSSFYVYFEQYLWIENVAVLGVLLALAAIFLLSLTLVRDVWVSLIVALNVAFVMVNSLGFMALWGIQINAVTVVNLIVGVGVCVEYSVHVGCAFAFKTGTRAHRVTAALAEIGSAVFRGFESSLYGNIVLAFSGSKIFEIFYFRMFLLLYVFGALHGFLLMPVMLAILGPTSDADRKLRSSDKLGKPAAPLPLPSSPQNPESSANSAKP
jgi:Niemann-Pick C1 protein